MFDTSEPPLFSWASPYGGHLVFARVCPDCNRFVKPHEKLNYSESFDGFYTFEPNAECKKHGPVIMPFMGDM